MFQKHCVSAASPIVLEDSLSSWHVCLAGSLAPHRLSHLLLFTLLCCDDPVCCSRTRCRGHSWLKYILNWAQLKQRSKVWETETRGIKFKTSLEQVSTTLLKIENKHLRDLMGGLGRWLSEYTHIKSQARLWVCHGDPRAGW